MMQPSDCFEKKDEPKQTLPTEDIGQTFFSKMSSKWAFKQILLAMHVEYNVL